MSIVPGSEPGKLSEVLGDGCQKELVPGTVWTPRPQSGQVEDPLEVGKQHFDFLPLVSRRLAGLRPATPTGQVTGIFMFFPRDRTGIHVGTACLFRRAGLTICLQGTVLVGTTGLLHPVRV